MKITSEYDGARAAGPLGTGDDRSACRFRSIQGLRVNCVIINLKMNQSQQPLRRQRQSVEK